MAEHDVRRFENGRPVVGRRWCLGCGRLWQEGGACCPDRAQTMLVSDHDRIVAEKDARIAELERSYAALLRVSKSSVTLANAMNETQQSGLSRTAARIAELERERDATGTHLRETITEERERTRERDEAQDARAKVQGDNLALLRKLDALEQERDRLREMLNTLCVVVETSDTGDWRLQPLVPPWMRSVIIQARAVLAATTPPKGG